MALSHQPPQNLRICRSLEHDNWHRRAAHRQRVSPMSYRAVSDRPHSDLAPQARYADAVSMTQTAGETMVATLACESQLTLRHLSTRSFLQCQHCTIRQTADQYLSTTYRRRTYCACCSIRRDCLDSLHTSDENQLVPHVSDYLMNVFYAFCLRLFESL